MMRQFPLAAFNPPSGLFRSTLSLRRIPPEAPLGLIGCEGGIMQDPKAASENTWNGGPDTGRGGVLLLFVFFFLHPLLLRGGRCSRVVRLLPAAPPLSPFISGLTFVGCHPAPAPPL